MQISRRDVLRSTAALGGLTAAGGLGLADAAVAARVSAPPTTSAVTLGKGAAGAGGWCPVVQAPGDRRVVRTGLGARAHRGRAGRRRSLLAFAQLSDVHICDAQSPVRIEYGEAASSSAYRPQEMLTGHVADAMVREINAVGRGPVTGRRLAFALQTGDNSDTAQYNEIRWNIDVLDGGTLRVDSGDLTRYEGVMDQESAFYDPMFWHPDGTPPGRTDDAPRATYGFPTVPGLLDAARRPFDAAGLAMPWYSAMGNHDGLVQGNFTLTAGLNTKATGSTKPTSKGDRSVTPDPDRRLVSREQWVAEHFTTTGLPVGHGFTAENRTKKTAYYTFDQGAVRFVVLDTVATFGDKGALDDVQLAWLTRVLERTRRKLVVVASHHPLATFSDTTLADRIERTLLHHPHVVAWVNGHTHTNQIWAHARRVKGQAVSGFWEINTASHIDWPQQSRLVELADNRDGTLSIFTTMLDHGGSLTFDDDPARLSDPTNLAGLSRLLAANDWQERSHDRRGPGTARNVELLVPAPAFLRR